ncbi:MAG: hypothetical protein LBD21_04525 [Tannerellaceae bacterium]|nr:hypothetical protein [Tannerellaceae bacterium]
MRCIRPSYGGFDDGTIVGNILSSLVLALICYGICKLYNLVIAIMCKFGHDWNGCKCKRCGATRDEGHDWDGCRCKLCGKGTHDWDGRRCTRCDKTAESCSNCGGGGYVIRDYDTQRCSDCGGSGRARDY